MQAKFTERENVVVIERKANNYITIYVSDIKGRVCDEVYNSLVKVWIAECEVCYKKDCILTKK